jgi:Gpi18-like mannosyltransferase
VNAWATKDDPLGSLHRTNAIDERPSQEKTLSFFDPRRGRSVRVYLALLSLILGVKTLAIGWGAYHAHHSALSVSDYENNYHHHRVIARYKNPADIRFFELWVAADPQWYFAIADSGYPTRAELDKPPIATRPKLISQMDRHLRYVFFPLWPVTIFLFHVIIPELFAAGFVAANVISTAALLGVFSLFRRLDAGAAPWALLLYVAWPFALFLHLPFSEPLFLGISVLVFWASQERRWFLAGLFAGLAVVTRPTGIALLSVPLICFLAPVIRARRFSRRDAFSLLCLSSALLPLAALLIHHGMRVGDPLFFTHVNEWWGYDSGAWLSNFLANTIGTAETFALRPWHGFHYSRIDFLVLVAAGIGCFFALRSLPLHYNVYSISIILIPLVTKGDLMSFCRYSLLAWPLFLLPARLMRGRVRAWACGVAGAASLVGQLFWMGRFVNWQWVG